MPPKKAIKAKRQPRVNRNKKARVLDEDLLSSRSSDVGFGGIPIRPAVIQQTQSQQIQQTIGSTNQLLGQLKAQQVTLDKELDRVKKQTGAVVDKDFLEDKNELKLEDKSQSKLLDFYSLDPKFSKNRLDTTLNIDKAMSDYKILEGRAKKLSSNITPEQGIDYISFPVSKKETSVEVLEPTSYRALTLKPSYLQPMVSVTRTKEPLQQPSDITKSLREDVLASMSRENVDLRGFNLGSGAL